MDNTIKQNLIKGLKIRKATIKDTDSIIEIQKKDSFDHSYYLNHKRLKQLIELGEVF